MRTLSIKARLLRIASGGVAISVLMVSVYLWTARATHQLTQRYQNSSLVVGKLNDISLSLQDISLGNKGLLLDSQDKEEWNARNGALDHLQKAIEDTIESARNPSIHVRLSAMRDEVTQVLVPVEAEFDAELKADPKTAAKYYQDKYRPVRAKIDNGLAIIRTLASAEADELYLQQEHLGQMGQTLTLVVLLFGLSWILISLRRVALSFSLSLRDISSEVLNSADSFIAFSRKLNAASGTLHHSARNQANSVKSALTIMDSLTAITERNGDSIEKWQASSNESAKESETAKDTLIQMVSAMEDIQRSNLQLEKVIDFIDEIRDKTRVIDQIVFKTQILAFNASIEAARAGVHGRGFSVIAEEVGKLASLSGEAAKKIGDLLETSVSEVKIIVQSTRESVEMGKGVSGACEATFNVLNEKLQKVSSAIREIEAASNEQSEELLDVNQLMSKINDEAAGNSLASDGVARESAELYGEAGNLLSSVQKLQSLTFGEKNTPSSKATSIPEGETCPLPEANGETATAPANEIVHAESADKETESSTDPVSDSEDDSKVA